VQCRPQFLQLRAGKPAADRRVIATVQHKWLFARRCIAIGTPLAPLYAIAIATVIDEARQRSGDGTAKGMNEGAGNKASGKRRWVTIWR
jgi:hypothetical protein